MNGSGIKHIFTACIGMILAGKRPVRQEVNVTLPELKGWPVLHGVLWRGDYNGDRTVDVIYYQSETCPTWSLWDEYRRVWESTGFGMNGDIPVMGDFDGDKTHDYAVFRPKYGNWHCAVSSNPAAPCSETHWGSVIDIPMHGDYNGDGVSDYVVFRPENGVWYVKDAKRPQYEDTVKWGSYGYVPISGDFNGDGISDYTVWSPETGVWHIRFGGANVKTTTVQWGNGGDIPVSGDFNNDCVYDFIVYRPRDKKWYIKLSESDRTLVFDA